MSDYLKKLAKAQTELSDAVVELYESVDRLKEVADKLSPKKKPELKLVDDED